MDVGVDRERRHTERLGHHDTGGLVADAGERLEEVPVGDDLAAGIDDLVRRGAQVPSLRRCQPDLADVAEDHVGVERGHLLGRAGDGEQRRRHLVDLLVGGLRRERHRDQHRVGVGVIERHRRVGIEIVEDLADPVRLVLSSHAGDGTRKSRYSPRAASIWGTSSSRA